MTPSPLADVLAAQLRWPRMSCLELGVGAGAIAKACLAASGFRRYVGVDIDYSLLQQAVGLSCVELSVGDVLSPRAIDEILGRELFDCSVGNPPYGMTTLPRDAQERMRELCPGLSLQGVWGYVDIYFFLESLSRLKRPGEVAFLLGPAVAEAPELRVLRATLAEQASELECYEVPSTSFGATTEVSAYLLVARFGAAKCSAVRIGRLDDNFQPHSLYQLPLSRAADGWSATAEEFRMADLAIRSRGGATLAELGAQITRGSRTRAEFLSLAVSHFHSSDFPVNGDDIVLGNQPSPEYHCASQGDILISRVGTRCVGRVAYVAGGQRPFTDVVFRVKVSTGFARRAAAWMSSRDGQTWLRKAATGSCAKHLTVSRLLSMPIPG